ALPRAVPGYPAACALTIRFLPANAGSSCSLTQVRFQEEYPCRQAFSVTSLKSNMKDRTAQIRWRFVITTPMRLWLANVWKITCVLRLPIGTLLPGRVVTRLVARHLSVLGFPIRWKPQ